MSELFLKIVNMSISASWIVLVILLLRLLLKKVPKWVTVLLWGIVAVRLICPFSIESALSLLPSPQTISTKATVNQPAIDSGVPIIDYVTNPIIGETAVSLGTEKDVSLFQFIMPYLAWLWLLGITALLIYTVFSCVRVKKKIGTAVLLRDNIFQSESVVSPFVLGIIKPKIYLPFNMNEQVMNLVTAHENAHIRRKDHWWKPFGFLVLTLHWFNPLMWLGYVLLCRDIELACDEKVIKEFNSEQKADYSQALLTCSVNRRMIAACPIAFGEVGVKARVKSVLNYKKPAFWIVVAAIVASVAVAVCFLTNPKSDSSEYDMSCVSQQSSTSELAGLSLEIVSLEASAPDPYLTVQYKNGSHEDIIYGEEFYIYRRAGDAWENCRIDPNYCWNDIGYYMSPGAKDTHEYNLNGLIMSEPGKYKFETNFSVDGKPETKYKVYIEFELTHGVDGVTVHSFDPVELVYTMYSYSYVQTAEAAPYYRLAGGMGLQSIDDGGTVTPICGLERIKLNKDNFDSRFTEKWLDGYSAKALKKNNKRAWQQTLTRGGLNELYLLLEQNDGSFYLGYGYYDAESEGKRNPDGSHIRWLYRLDSVSSIELGESGEMYVAEQTYEYSSEKDTARLYLSTDDKQYLFQFSWLSSYAPYGAYEDDGNYIILKTDDGKNSYTFRKEGDSLVFIADRSSVMPSYAYSAGVEPEVCVPDGAAFKKLR